MNAITFNKHNQRYFALLWLCLLAALVSALIWLLPRTHINSSVLDLLPQSHVDGISPHILDKFSQRLDRQLIWLISPHSQNEDQQTIQAVNWWEQQLKLMGVFKQVNGGMSAQQQDLFGEFSLKYRAALLDAKTEQRLLEGSQAQWILGQVYSFAAGVSAKELSLDPLLLMRSAFSKQALQLSQGSSRLAIKTASKDHDSRLAAKDDEGRTWYVVYGELESESYNFKSSRLIVAQLKSLEKELLLRFPDTQILQRGVIFYSDYAGNKAQQDIFTLGIGSSIGIIALLLLVFRSFKPIWLTILSILMGILAGTVGVLAVFGQIHITTLVMSSSVIGICIDYGLHFLSERIMHSKTEAPAESLNKLFPALSMALISSVIAYCLLYFAPFPGLKQLAVFAVCGLSAAFMTVICCYPVLTKNMSNRELPYLNMINIYVNAWKNSKLLRFTAPTIIFIIMLIGLFNLKIDDDISKLQSLPVHLQTQERQIAKIIGQGSEQKWFIIYGDNAEQALKRLALFGEKLAHEQQLSYRLLPLPSQTKQQQNIDLIKQNKPIIMEQLKQAGLDLISDKSDLNDLLITPQQWLDSPLSEGWRLLWLSLEDQTAILVPVEGNFNSADLAQLAAENIGVHWVDRRMQYTALFTVYRISLTALLGIVIMVVSGIFLLKFGVKQGLRCSLSMILSVGMGLAVLGLTGQVLNLFSLMAAILVLGIGIDYALFFSNSKVSSLTSMLSII